MKKIGVRIGVAIFVILYIILATYSFDMSPENRETPSGIKPQEKEAFGGIVTVWNINTFRPYSGSFSAILNSVCKDIEKKYFGVYFEVVNMSQQTYESMIETGEKADIISFPCGLCYEEQFTALPQARLSSWSQSLGVARDVIYALPYAASGYVIAVNVDRCNELQYEMKKELSIGDIYVENELAGNELIAAVNGVNMPIMPIDDFIAGKAMFALCDMATVGDIIRLQANGRGFEIKAYPLSGYTDEVQLIGISKAMDKEKKKYALAFIEALLNKYQVELIKNGLFPVTDCQDSPDFAPKPLKNIFIEEKNLYAPNAFLYRKHMQPLAAAAQRALLGDEAAKNDIQARLLELVEDWKIE